MDDNKSFIVVLFQLIISVILIVFFILNLIWLKKLMKYSNYKELSREKINDCLKSSYISTSTTSKRKLYSYLNEDYYICECLNDIYYKKCTFNQINDGCFIKKNNKLIRFLKLKKQIEMLKQECDFYSNLFSDYGAIKTFKFDSKNMYKYSNILYIVNIVGILASALVVLFIILNVLLLAICEIKVFVYFTAIFVLIVETIGKFILFILHLVYFILLVRTHRDFKYKDFKDFSSCDNINKKIYEDNYNFLFLIEEYYHKVYIYNIIILIVSVFSFCYRTCLGIKKDN